MVKLWRYMMLAAAWPCLAAAEPEAASSEEGAGASLALSAKAYALGVDRYRLDDHTEMWGWQVSDSWYFGRQRGLDSGLTLVWQHGQQQFSVSKDGLRLTRRF